MPGSVLTTERLQLRPIAPAHGAALEALFADPVVRRYLLDDTVMPREWIDEVIVQSEADFAERRCGLWRVGAAEGDALVGVVGYRDFFEPPVFELIWILHPDHHGRGLAVEAARAALQHGFEAGSLDPIHASIDSPNAASIRVAGRLGFRETGREPGPNGATLHFALSHADFASS